MCGLNTCRGYRDRKWNMCIIKLIFTADCRVERKLCRKFLILLILMFVLPQEENRGCKINDCEYVHVLITHIFVHKVWTNLQDLARTSKGTVSQGADWAFWPSRSDLRPKRCGCTVKSLAIFLSRLGTGKSLTFFYSVTFKFFRGSLKFHIRINVFLPVNTDSLHLT